MYHDVLVPTDGSRGALDALDHALEIAAARDATVHALYVVNRRLYVAAEDGEQDAVREELQEEGEAALDELVERAEGAGVDTRRVMHDGIPHREILEYADEAGIDLVVMGTHGRTGRDRLVSLGSVTERVVERSETPVLTVRIAEQESGPGPEPEPTDATTVAADDADPEE